MNELILIIIFGILKHILIFNAITTSMRSFLELYQNQRTAFD